MLYPGVMKTNENSSRLMKFDSTKNFLAFQERKMWIKIHNLLSFDNSRYKIIFRVTDKSVSTE